jgi:predicted nucleotide-binding protein (sugar kinase/HSP70/actin superfamily)
MVKSLVFTGLFAFLKYSERAIKNADDSDVTLIIYKEKQDEGTKLTVTLCIKLNKPCLLMDLSEHFYKTTEPYYNTPY